MAAPCPNVSVRKCLTDPSISSGHRRQPSSGGRGSALHGGNLKIGLAAIALMFFCVRRVSVDYSDWVSDMTGISFQDLDISHQEYRNPYRNVYGPSFVVMFRDEATMERLKVDETTKGSIQKILESWETEMEAMELRGMKWNDPESDSEVQENIEGKLTEDQRKLAHFLDLELEGGYVLFSNEIAKRLKLRDRQKRELKKLAEQNEVSCKEMRNMIDRKYLGKEEKARVVNEHREKADKALFDIVSETQRMKLRKLLSSV